MPSYNTKEGAGKPLRNKSQEIKANKVRIYGYFKELAGVIVQVQVQNPQG